MASETSSSSHRSTKRTRQNRPVWAHGPSNRNRVRELIVGFCAGRDVEPVPACDEALLRHDLATNEAALLNLAGAGVLSKKESRLLATALTSLRSRVESGDFSLDPSLEDVHINIEQALGRMAGDAAGKLHSGRSRNDQVACDLRLWHREKVLTHLEGLLDLLQNWIDRAVAEKATVMPGFTHHQRAFVTTWGHTLLSYVQAWLRDVERGISVYDRINRSPLGAAAGFGTSWPLDRQRMADWLGFDSVLENSADAISSRTEVETEIAAWLAVWMNHSSLVAQDLILFSMEEFRWVRLAPEVTTGSSIMPQKRNPDFAEVIKGKTSLVQGYLASLLSLGKGQPSGYHRDSQYSKPIGQDLWREVDRIPEVFGLVFDSLRLDRKRMRQATRGGFLEAAEWADAIAQESGLPFRIVYSCIGQAVDACRTTGRLTRSAVNRALKRAGLSYQVPAGLAKRLGSPEGLLEGRLSPGSPNPGQVECQAHHLQESVAAWKRSVEKRWKKIRQSDTVRRKEIRSLL